jgi:hypothetical protein
MHQMSVAGPMYDLPTCLSKFLALGLNVRDVVAMATEGPARILRFADRGTFRVGALDALWATAIAQREDKSSVVGFWSGGRRHPVRYGTLGSRRHECPYTRVSCELAAKGHTTEQMCHCSTVMLR